MVAWDTKTSDCDLVVRHACGNADQHLGLPGAQPPCLDSDPLDEASGDGGREG